MKNIRTFILCSSMVLVAWLAASYSNKLENIDPPASLNAVTTPAAPTTGMPASEEDKDRLTPTASLTSAHLKQR